VAAKFEAAGTWHVPTLIRSRSMELGAAPEYMSDPHLRYIRPDVVELWREVMAEFSELSPETRATNRDFYSLRLRVGCWTPWG